MEMDICGKVSKLQLFWIFTIIIRRFMRVYYPTSFFLLTQKIIICLIYLLASFCFPINDTPAKTKDLFLIFEA
jgi:hypothetical protein